MALSVSIVGISCDAHVETANATNRAVPTSSTAGTNDLSVTVTLAQTEVRGGATIAGKVVVTNHTGAQISEPLACRDTALAVALSSGNVMTAWGWSAVGCIKSFAFPAGTTTMPIAVITVYDATRGLAPLPPGRYEATLHLNRFPLPIPRSIPVTIRNQRPSKINEETLR